MQVYMYKYICIFVYSQNLYLQIPFIPSLSRQVKKVLLEIVMGAWSINTYCCFGVQL